MRDCDDGLDGDIITLPGVRSQRVLDRDLEDGEDDAGLFVLTSRLSTRDVTDSCLSDSRAERLARAMRAWLLAEAERECNCELHEGTRVLPVSAFSGEDRFCLNCRRKLAAVRRDAEDARQGRQRKRRRSKGQPPARTGARP